MLELAKGVKERGLNITSFSGYTYEQLTDMAAENDAVKKLLDMTDILVDGPYIKAQRDLTLRSEAAATSV
ncbi:MAG: 4Fe-4S cluster-binding domain-containing protein [Anaerovoracaceae bacterium]